MKKLWIGLMLIAAFIGGWYSHRPGVITKTEIERIYSLPEGVSIQEFCDNFYGAEVRRQRQEIIKATEEWSEGYKQGLQERH